MHELVLVEQKAFPHRLLGSEESEHPDFALFCWPSSVTVSFLPDWISSQLFVEGSSIPLSVRTAVIISEPQRAAPLYILSRAKYSANGLPLSQHNQLFL